jgi:uncharacterized protein (TIGR02246 family)
MTDEAQDRLAIQAVVAGLAEAWGKGDGRAWGSYFTEDADFTAWFGLYLKGRDAIAAAHQQIFDTVYKNTNARLEICSLRFLRPDVAVVHFNGSVVGEGEELPAEPQVVPVAVLTKEGGSWRVAVFQNTKNSMSERITGDIRK